MRRLGLLVLPLVLSACSQPRGSSPSAAQAPPTSPAVASSASSPAPKPPSHRWKAAQVVYATSFGDDVPDAQQDDVWLYKVVSDAVRRLTHDGDRGLQLLPRFRRPGEVSFVKSSGRGRGNERETIRLLDLETMKVTDVLTWHDRILD